MLLPCCSSPQDLPPTMWWRVFITKLRHKLQGEVAIKILNVRGVGYKLIKTNLAGQGYKSQSNQIS